MQNETDPSNEKNTLSKSASKLLESLEISRPFTDDSFPARPKLDFPQRLSDTQEELSLEKINPTKFIGHQASFGPCLDGTESQISAKLYKNLGIQYEQLESKPSEANSEAFGFRASRFEHVITEDGHAVITRGELLRCEDEPIHAPEAIQSFGALIALKESQSRKLMILIVSENSNEIIGYSPQELFQLDCFTDILAEQNVDILMDRIKLTRNADITDYGPEVFTLSIKQPSIKRDESQVLWCALHVNPTQPDLIICEFELEHDFQNPLIPENNVLLEVPEDMFNNNISESEYAESTIPINRPLRINNISHKRQGEPSTTDMFNTVSQVLEQLAAAPDSDTFCRILAGIVKELTGFHRVMIYQFDASYNGRVVSEVLDPHVSRQCNLYFLLRTSDIPPQARRLYQVNKVVVLYDRENVTSRLIYRSRADFKNSLDLSYSYLRAISPIHIKYLNNMAVRSSMSMSINSLNHLWGLIACHAYGSKGTRVSFPMRQMFRIVGNAASRNVERLFCVSHLHTRKLFNTNATKKDTSEFVFASTDDLLKIFSAEFGLLSIQGVNKIIGSCKKQQEAFTVQKYFETRKVTSIISSQDIRSDFPDLKCPTGFEVITGLLVLPLSASGNDFLLFFRKEQVLEVKWAGNPYDKITQHFDIDQISPRRSFKVWKEKVIGKSREWNDEQIEAAVTLCSMYWKFIEVWRQNEEILPKNQLTKLLLANSAHELRTPLNAIINYLEIAMEAPLDQETRHNLGQSCYASKSLIYVINDLLDLTKAEQGHELVRDEIFDLHATVEEAMLCFKGDALRKGLNYQVDFKSEVPQFVIGDQRRLRQAIFNLIANSMQFTTHGFVWIQVLLKSDIIGGARIEIMIEDSGCGISDQEIEEMFRDLDNVIIELNVPDENRKLFGNFLPSRSENQKLGLGLATVLRIVRIMNGKLRIKSEKGKGSRFIIEVDFNLPGFTNTQKSHREQSSGSHSASILKPTEMKKIVPHDYKNSPLAQSYILTSNSENINRNQSDSSQEKDYNNLLEKKNEKNLALKNIKVPDKDVPEFMRLNNNKKTTRGLDENPFDMSNNINSQSPDLGIIKNPLPDKAAHSSITRIIDSHSNESSNTSLEKLGFAIRKEVSPREGIGNLQVLLAEDDFVNCKIIHKRLGKSGHKVHQTVNGGECAKVYAEKKDLFDVILMDIQMPIVDGMKSTKMIRSFENNDPKNVLSKHARSNGRVPILAVSASLCEDKRQIYIDTGFDGWIMKPIDFKRLNTLLRGISETSIRDSCLYSPGKWEKGGWFGSRQTN
ncbi:putative cyanobacterial phytochrome b [Erysiphe necator]|uniref:Putative cyanobacterial phytochrome b n=1 Tax=Uncinula necator TaxID=52586 RepID=A0A0B1P8X5_UNCNE|nr:putative cyanobacterial phytochrome b [Erysiphe necator]